MDDFDLLFLVTLMFYAYKLARACSRLGVMVLYQIFMKVHRKEYAEVERLSALIKDHPQATPKVRAAVLRCLGLAKICQGRLEEARNDLALALEYNPRDGRAYLVQAMANWYEHPQSALLSLERAVRFRPFFCERLYHQTVARFRGLALVQLGQAQEALDQFAAMRPGRDPFVSGFRAQALALVGRYQEALQHFKEQGQADPRQALGLFLLGARRPAESLFWLERSEQPTVHTLFFKAGALSELGRERESCRCLQEWNEILSRPADFCLFPAMTEFGRTHLIQRPTANRSCWLN